MKKEIKKYLIIKEPVFKSSLNVFLNYSFDELNNFLKKRGFGLLDEKFKHDTGICFTEFKNGHAPCFTVWIKDFKWILSNQALLLHELAHYIFVVMAYKGLIIGNAETDANETYCYLLEYFFLELNRKISRLTL